MSILDYAAATEEIRTLLKEDFDVVLLDSLQKPQDPDGRICFPVPAKTFAYDNDQGQYLILQDGTVGYMDGDGHAGRMSENLEEFFLLVANCGNWKDFIHVHHPDRSCLTDYEQLDEMIQQHPCTEKQELLSELLDVPVFSQRQIVILRFYETTLRSPLFQVRFRQADGSWVLSKSLLIKTKEE